MLSAIWSSVIISPFSFLKFRSWPKKSFSCSLFSFLSQIISLNILLSLFLAFDNHKVIKKEVRFNLFCGCCWHSWMDDEQDISYQKSFVVSSSWNFCWKWIVTLIYDVVVVTQRLSIVAVQVAKDRKNADIKRKLWRTKGKGEKQLLTRESWCKHKFEDPVIRNSEKNTTKKFKLGTNPL